MDKLLQAKKALRRQMQSLRDAVPVDVRDRAAAELARSGFTKIAARVAPAGTVVAGYLPFRSEIDPLPLMRALADAGARLALPRMAGEDLVLHAYTVGEKLLPGPYGILEPSDAAPRVMPGIILTPLLAFDAEGGRLGYGKGFYDRLFAAHPAALRVGLALTVQRAEMVPRAPHDVPLHLVLTAG